jgi:integrase
MDQIKEIIKKYRPTSKDITIDNHVRHIKILFEHYGGKKTLLEYLSNTKKVIKDLEDKYPKISTRSSYICSIFVYLRAVEADQKVIDYYYQKFIEMKKELKEIDEKNEKSEKEEKNWVSQLEIKQKIEDLKKSFGKSRDLFDTYQQYLVLNLYFLIPPLRNDFARVEVFKKFDEKFTGNSINLNTKQLILKEYKTAKTYGTKTIDLPEELIKIIKKWISIREKIHPVLKGRRELLFNLKLTPMNGINLTIYLNKIFGRKVSSTMLRKSYLSDRFPVIESTDELNKLAGAMCHSVSMQQSTYRKK